MSQKQYDEVNHSSQNIYTHTLKQM